MSSSYQRSTKSLSITSGKGGVGKTFLVSNLAYSLALRGKRVLIFDGDLGLSNVDLHFGTRIQSNLLEVINKEKTVSEVVHSLAPNIDLISGGSGIMELARLNSFQRRFVMDSMGQINRQYDYLLIDTATGISDQVLELNSAAQQICVMITPDPSSFADAYALIKILYTEKKEKRFSIVCNMVRDDMEGIQLFNKFSDVAQRFLLVALDYWGAIPTEAQVKKSILSQRLIMKHEPQAVVSQALMNVSNKLEQSFNSNERKSGLQFFWEQVVGVA